MNNIKYKRIHVPRTVSKTRFIKREVNTILYQLFLAVPRPLLEQRPGNGSFQFPKLVKIIVRQIGLHHKKHGGNLVEFQYQLQH